MKKYKNYFIAFFLPFFVCVVFLYAKGIFQDIENIYVSDLRLQHLPFLHYLRSVLLGDASVYYSFSAGLGSPMIATLIFYCISPVNLLLLLVKDIEYGILFTYIIKVSLSGLTMYILLKYRKEKNDFITVLFSSCYALCTFVINYFFCIFWFDSLYLAPLVTLGIDRMFREEKMNLLYIFSLALAIMCNIQMGFGLCIYALVYYIYSFNIRYGIKKDLKKFRQLGIIFIISSLCAGAISSGILLGFMSEYGNIATARDINVETRVGTSNLGYILKNLFTVGGVKTDFYNNFEPYIYCGLIVSFFSILYLFNQEVESKKRLHAFFVILVFVMGFCVDFINLFWHLSTPVLLNFRYSGYLSLFLVLLAYECYVTKKRLNKRDIVVLSISLLVGLFMIIAYNEQVNVIETFLFLIFTYVLIILVKNKNKRVQILLSISVIVELLVNSYLSLYTAKQLPFGKDSSYKSLKELANKNNFDDDYRVIYDYSYTDFTNDSFLLNKNSSPRYFSSVINGNLLLFLHRNESMIGNNNYRVSAFDSPLLLSILGNKYFYLTQEFNNDLFKKIDSYKIGSYDYVNDKYQKKDVYLYENQYALSIGFMIGSDVKYQKKDSFIDYQNKMIKAFTGNFQDVMFPLPYESSTSSEECMDSGYYNCQQLDITNHALNKFVYIYGLFDEYLVFNNSKIYFDSGVPFVVSTLDNNIGVVFKYNGSKIQYKVATFDEVAFMNSINILRENMLTDVKINKNIMTGMIDSSKDGILFLSIPYDDKFKIYVDGKKVKYYPLLNHTFIGLDLKAGVHQIKIEYIDDDLIWYILSTLLSIVITIILYYFINKKIKKIKEEEKKYLEEMAEKSRKKKENRSKKK